MAHREHALTTATVPRPERRIQRSRGLIRLDVAELWRFRELLAFLVWRDTKVRYKQTFLGLGWGLIRPLTSMVVFTVIFGKLVGVQTGSDVPYALFVFAGLLPWLYFTSALTGAGSSILNNANLVTKTYFPRLLVPLAAAVAPIVDFALSSVVYAALFVYYHRWPSWHLIAVPPLMLLAVATSLGAGIWLAAITVRYRDIQFVIPFLTQLLMYMTPVIYPVTLVPQAYRWIIAINPMAAVINGFRWATLGEGTTSWPELGLGVAIAVALLVTGVAYFERAQSRFADVI